MDEEAGAHGADADARWRRWALQPPVALDAALAVVLVAVGVGGLMSGAMTSIIGGREPDALAYALAVLSAAPVAVRSRAPVAALALALPAALAAPALGHLQVNGGLGALLCLYSVAALTSRRTSIPTALLTALALTVLLLTAPYGFGLADVLANALGVALVWGAGAWSRSRAQYVRGLEERNAALLAARESQARAALADARSAVAREMQDVVGHGVMAMTVQASAARRVLGRDPEAAERALVEVERLGRSAVQEVRRVLGVLGVEEAPSRPQPGLEDLPDLVAAARGRGLDVELTRDGEDVVLDTGADLAAYRVVEEALANAERHAGPARVRVLLHGRDGRLEVEVADDGRGASAWGTASAAGVGLLALRDRVASYGGSVEAGPRGGGGYLLRAVLPTSAPAGSPR
ncbi:sensor histidine kinase [Kineococcus xinjiangensis]|uniref:sensor histidine kinase n=1 Tax=Kineococcus xinjiangensis TaxID=512762 RepID=UPI001304D351|nr:histidine kinase [Kineococcus xinjiangensis]